MSEVISAEAPHIIQVAREAERLKQTRIEEIDGRKVLITFDGQVKSLEQYATVPLRKRGKAVFYHVASFIQYVKRHFNKDQTHIYGKADELSASMTAIIDGHTEGSDHKQAAWCEHSAVLNFEVTPEWSRWVKRNRSLFTQEEFAEFIEENMADIISPDGADLLEMAQLLHAKKTVTFKSGKNLRDGSVQLEYVEAIEQQGGGVNRRDDSMKLPDAFTLNLTPFVGAESVTINGRLRFRISQDGRLNFQYVLERPHLIIKKAFEDASLRISADCNCEVMFGEFQKGSPSSL